ncbi:Mth938-like domain-containing protein [Robbsia sp. KACC 23696]|uniref:Mth938-like domain-containing protein n=1 Tax=Robbsia sp. KACC 23696 TaxID=3149231 RepID=UPI00325C2E3F
MKLEQESIEAAGVLNVVTGYGDDYVEINKTRFAHSVLLLPNGPALPWDPTRFEALAPAHFEPLVNATPELVLLGTGKKLRFGHPRLYAALTAKRIGVETMDIGAACRTFNILAAEGRRVAAALLLEKAD